MAFPRRISEELLVASGRSCCICHRFCGRKLEIHHVIPKSDGGGDTAENGIPLCFDCHADVHSGWNPRRGREYTSKELIKHKERWFRAVAKAGMVSEQCCEDTPGRIEIVDFAFTRKSQLDDIATQTQSIGDVLTHLSNGSLTPGKPFRDPLDLDVKLRNAGKNKAVLTRCQLRITDIRLIFRDIEWSPICSGLGFSAKYDILLSPLEKPKTTTISIAQVVRPDEVDRFRVRIHSRWEPQEVFHAGITKGRYGWGDALLYIVCYQVAVKITTADGHELDLGTAVLPFSFGKRSCDTWRSSAYAATSKDVAPLKDSGGVWELRRFRERIEIPDYLM